MGKPSPGIFLQKLCTSMQTKLTRLKVMGNPGSKCQFPFSILEDIAQQSLTRWISMKLGSETGSSTEPAGDNEWLEDEVSGGREPEDGKVSDVGAHLMN